MKVIVIGVTAAVVAALFGTSASLVVWLWRKTPRGFSPDDWTFDFPDDETAED